ncbi:MAG: RIP metalloprotease RseP [Bacteroidota bacterium]
MEILIKTAQFLLSISILVILHEFGHFIFARLFNTRVEKFYLFFNPWFSLFKFKKGETEYGMGWLPLGGYVKISGMIDESMDREQMKQPPQPHEFRSKPAWQRLLIMVGGVLVNFILAIVIYAAILFTWGEQYLPTSNARYGIMVDSLAMEAGFRNGDKIIALDNNSVEDFYDIVPKIVLNEVNTVQVKRNGEIADIHIPGKIRSKLLKDPSFIEARIPFVIGDFAKNSPALEAGMEVNDSIISVDGEKTIFFDEFKEKIKGKEGEEVTITAIRNNQVKDFTFTLTEGGLIGVAPYGITRYFDLEKLQYGFFESIPAGINKGINTIGDYLKQFKLIFSTEAKGYESLGGFITIGRIFPSTWNWQAFWSMTALLSIILAVMNLLPIPALDGGHVTFLLYEMVTGRKPGEKFLEYAQIAGMILILTLLVYANGNDIMRYVFNQ